jgi:flagellar export protein FliJ
MSSPRRLRQLGQLVELREREVDRLGAELADKRAVRERYLANLARLEELCVSTGASGAQQAAGESGQSFSPALSLNIGSYKQTVMRMADAHRVDLSLHELEMQNTQTLVAAAARKHAALDQTLARMRARFDRHREARQQKRLDEIAAQVWLRGRK